jgi:hypothetical protein
MPPKGGVYDKCPQLAGKIGQMPQGEGPATQGTPDKV